MSQEDVNKVTKNFATKPIGDTSRWYAEQYAKAGIVWNGKISPDAPKNHQEEKLPKLEPSLFPEWIKCRICGVEFQSTGFAMTDHLRKLLGMSPKQEFGYPTVCQPCADAWDARGGPPPGFYVSPPEHDEPQEPEDL